MARLFGTDGVRGKANVAPMDSESIMRLGRAAAHVLMRSEGRHRILIGKDTRLSGYMLEQALASGITSMGVDILICGPLPTPGVAYMTRSMRCDAGVMISASHNPYEDNGIKFFGSDGFKLADATEDEIERLMEPGHLDELRAVPERIGKAVRIEDAIGRYTVYLKSCISKETSFEGFKVVIDSAHGAAYRVAPLVFTELGATIVTLGDRPDGKNINKNCGSLHPEALAKKVVDEGANAGVAFDGDADRVVICDEKGNIFDGDELLAILAFEFMRRGKLKGDAVVATTMSNLGLEVALRQKGIKLHRSDVGDRYVLQEMLKENLTLGGEQSGHLISLDHNTTGDGILSALLVLETAIRSNSPLSAYQSIVTRYPQVLLNVPVARKPPFAELPNVQKALAGAEKSLAGKGRILLRYSGTEQKARVMVECEDESLCKTTAEEMAALIRAELAQ
jgi:phosphoglucosamine mutase